MKRRVTSPHVPEPPPGRFSRCLVAGDQVFISGMTAWAPTAIEGGDSMHDQAVAIFTRIKHLMEAAGGRMDDIVRLTFFVTDITRREEISQARARFFTGDFPTSTLVEVVAITPGAIVEIEATAILGAGG